MPRLTVTPPLEPVVCIHINLYLMQHDWVLWRYRALIQEYNWSGDGGGVAG